MFRIGSESSVGDCEGIETPDSTPDCADSGWPLSWRVNVTSQTCHQQHECTHRRSSRWQRTARIRDKAGRFPFGAVEILITRRRRFVAANLSQALDSPGHHHQQNGRIHVTRQFLILKVFQVQTAFQSQKKTSIFQRIL